MKTRKRFSFLFTLLQACVLTISYGQTGTGWTASKETEERLSKSRQEFNYFEDKIKPYILPDVLTSPSGKKSLSTANWEKYGRPELLELFRTNVFGRVPSTSYIKSFKIVSEDKNALSGAATFKQVDITITSGDKSLVIHLNLYIPNKAAGPVPAFLLINLGAKGIDPQGRQKPKTGLLRR
jgi:hypothetical protein